MNKKQSFEMGVCVCVCQKIIQEWAQKNKEKKSAQSLKDEGIRTVSQRVP